MDRFRRLIVGVLLLLSSSAWASFPATADSSVCTVAPCYSGWATYGVSMTPQPTEAGAAVIGCTVRIGSAPVSPYPYYTANFQGWMGPGWACSASNLSSVVHVAAAPQSPVYSCPSNAMLSGSTCTCSAGFVQNGNSCGPAPDPCLEKAGKSAGRYTFPYVKGASVTTGPGVNLCEPLPASAGTTKYPGCSLTVAYDIAYPNGDGTWTKAGDATYGGGCAPGTGDGSVPGTAPPVSTPDAPIPGAPAPTPCKAGQYSGTVNGVAVCVPANGDKNVIQPVKGPTTTAPEPGGSTTGPISGLGPNAPPSAVSSDIDTVCTQGICRTTETFRDGTGAIVGTRTKDESQASFCADNPRVPMCVESSFSGGDCAAPPTCGGDAVQCAVAQFTYATKCALTTAPANDPNIDTFNKAAAKDQGDQTGSMTSTVNIGASSFDQTDLLGPRVDLVDQVVTVAGTSVTIPWSKASEKLRLIGLIMQAVTFLVCARIVMRG